MDVRDGRDGQEWSAPGVEVLLEGLGLVDHLRAASGDAASKGASVQDGGRTRRLRTLGTELHRGRGAGRILGVLARQRVAEQRGHVLAQLVDGTSVLVSRI